MERIPRLEQQDYGCSMLLAMRLLRDNLPLEGLTLPPQLCYFVTRSRFNFGYSRFRRLRVYP